MSKSTESKTVKEALKEAKENIDKKDFKSALKCCKRALNVDKNNYMALVFCGLCLAEVDQPDQALKVNITYLNSSWKKSIIFFPFPGISKSHRKLSRSNHSMARIGFIL